MNSNPAIHSGGEPPHYDPADVPTEVTIAAGDLLAKEVSFFENVRRNTSKHPVAVEEILRQIRAGAWREPVEQVRAARATSKKAADSLKLLLPAVTFSGIFSARTIGGLARHSGLLCTDLDDLGEKLAQARRTLAGDPHVLAVFLSPSGTGLKVLSPVIASNAEEHAACYTAAEAYFTSLGFPPDPACKDVSRLCFVSWDPDCWAAAHGVRLSPFCLNSAPYTAATCNLNPAPCNLHSTPYTTGGEDERVVLARARSEAARYLDEVRKTSPALVGLYDKLIAERWIEPRLHGRNDWLREAVPFLYRATSRAVGVVLALLHLKAYKGLYLGSEAEHRASFDSLWSGVEKNYPAELSEVELGVYETLSEPDASTFRISRDFALGKPHLIFYLADDHLASRLGRPGEVNGWRILRRFVTLKYLLVVEKGRQRAKGRPSLATTYRWNLPTRDLPSANSRDVSPAPDPNTEHPK